MLVKKKKKSYETDVRFVRSERSLLYFLQFMRYSISCEVIIYSLLLVSEFLYVINSSFSFLRISETKQPIQKNLNRL